MFLIVFSTELGDEKSRQILPEAFLTFQECTNRVIEIIEEVAQLSKELMGFVTEGIEFRAEALVCLLSPEENTFTPLAGHCVTVRHKMLGIPTDKTIH